jgi:hypothetical protein
MRKEGGGNRLSNKIISGELLDKTAIFDATEYKNYVDGVEGQNNADEEIQFLDPDFLEEILDCFDDSEDEASMFTADAGIMGDESVKGPESVKKKFSARHRCPTLQLEPADLIDDSVRIRQLHHIDDLRKEHSIIDPRRGYVPGDDFSDFCVIPGEKPIYDGKKYVESFLDSIKPISSSSKMPTYAYNFERRIHAIADNLHNIPYIALRTYNTIKTDYGYRLEFTVLKKGRGFLPKKTRLGDFKRKINDIIGVTNGVLKLDEVDCENTQIVRLIEEKRIEYERVLSMVLHSELLKNQEDSLRKANHQDINIAAQVKIVIPENAIQITGVDDKQEILFELKFYKENQNEKKTIDTLDRVVRMLLVHFSGR